MLAAIQYGDGPSASDLALRATRAAERKADPPQSFAAIPLREVLEPDSSNDDVVA